MQRFGKVESTARFCLAFRKCGSGPFLGSG
jgi:hypothetical protein